MATPSVASNSTTLILAIIFFLFVFIASKPDTAELIGSRRFHQFSHQYFVWKSVLQDNAKRYDNTGTDFQIKNQHVSSKMIIKEEEFNSEPLRLGRNNTVMKETKTISKLNRTYENLLQMLETGNYAYCADMFGRNLQIPWTEQQRVRNEEFDNKFQETLQNILLEIHKVIQIIHVSFISF